MVIELSINFLSKIKDKSLLLDTSFFIDGFTHPQPFSNLVNTFKKQGVKVTTIQPVAIEFLRGAPNEEKYQEKKTFMQETIDRYLFLEAIDIENAEKLAHEYKKMANQ